MKKLTLLVLTCSLFVLLCCKQAPAATLPPDPDLGPSWLMMSFACAVDTATLQERYAGTIQVFGWNGEAYAAVDRLEPGKGYFINYDFDIAPIAVCPDGGDGITQLNLIQGWNLIGNPLDHAVAFNEFLAEDGSVPFVKIFSLVNNAFLSIPLDQNAQPGVAYWVYVPDSVSVMVIDKWQWTDIKITPQYSYSYQALPSNCLKTDEFIDGNFYPKSRPTQFRATAKIGIDSSARSEDVTERMEWNSLNPDVATVKKGLLTPLTAGWVTLEVKIKGATKTNLKIYIFDDTAPVCLALNPAGELDIAPQETLTLHAFTYTIDMESCNKYKVCKSKYEEITDQVEWRMDNEDTGKMVDNVFSAGKTEATVRIHAKLNKLKSNSIVINVHTIQISSLSMSISGLSLMPNECRISGNTSNGYSMATGSKLPIKVFGREKSKTNSSYNEYNYADNYGSSSVQIFDLSNTAKYTISDPSVAEVMNGTLHALKSGTVVISAGYGVYSTSYTINVVDKDTPLCLNLRPNRGATIPIEAAVTLSVIAISPKGNTNCEFGTASNGFCSEDVSNKVQWTLSDPSILTITGASAKAGKNLGTVNVSATFQGRSSNTIPIIVRARTISSLTVDIKGLSKAPNGCRLGSGTTNIYTMTTGSELPIKLTGYDYYSIYNDNYYGSTSLINIDLSDTARYNISNPSIAEVVNGTLHAIKPGTFTISGNSGAISSSTYTINVIEEGTPICVKLSPESGATIPPKGALTLSVTSYFSNGNANCESGTAANGFCSADVTDKVQWSISNPSQLTINGINAVAGSYLGTVRVSATYLGLPSNTISIEVKQVSWMIVFATMNAPMLPNCPYQGTYAGCYTTVPGKTHKLTSMAQQDSSIWTAPQSVTAMTKWEVSDTSVAEVDAAGNLKAKSQGLIWIRANVGDARSDKIWLAVNDKSGYEFLITGPAYNSGFKPLKPLQVGSSMQLKAVHYKYSPGTGSTGCYNSYSYTSTGCSSNYVATDITDKVQWIVSDSTLGSVSQPSGSACSYSSGSYNYSSCQKYTVFNGKSPGLVDVSARYNSIKSNSFTIDVWNYQNISYCDKNKINMGNWSDAYSRAELETDCNVYSRGEPVTLRYSAYIKDRAYLDNCLDMYVMDDKDNIVCTLREQGCTSEEIGRVSAKTANPVYQYVDTCDMKDKSGNPVPAGTYFAVARFYIMWEPVIRVPFQVVK